MEQSRQYLIGFLSSLQMAGMNLRMEQVMTILSMHKLCMKNEADITLNQVHQELHKIKKIGDSNLRLTVRQYLKILLDEEAKKINLDE